MKRANKGHRARFVTGQRAFHEERDLPVIKLRYDGRCHVCRKKIAAGKPAKWDAKRRVVFCRACS